MRQKTQEEPAAAEDELGGRRVRDKLFLLLLLLFCLRATQYGSEHRGPGALVPSPAGVRRTFPHVESAEDPSVRPLSAGGVSVQAASQGRGPDSPPAGLGAVPAYKEQRAGPESPGESGEQQQPQCPQSITVHQCAMLTLILCCLVLSTVVHFTASILFVYNVKLHAD